MSCTLRREYDVPESHGGTVTVDRTIQWCDGLRHYCRKEGNRYSQWMGACVEAVAEQRRAAGQRAQGDRPATWATTVRDEENGFAYDSARAFLASTTLRSLVMVGKPGRGKTWLAKAVMDEATTARKSVRFWMAADFADRARAADGWGDDAADARGLLAGLLTADLVILDDLGKETQQRADVVAAAMQRFLDAYRGKLIVTSNRSQADLNSLPTVGEHLLSRMYGGGTLVQMLGKRDRRSA